METISLKCKNCNGIVEVDPGKQVLFCPYCGSKELIPESDKVKIARIKAEAAQKKVEEREKTRRHDKKMELITVLVLFGGMIIAGIIGTLTGTWN